MKKENPFKFGSVVDGPYFTNRLKELDFVHNLLKSKNHLILISPRRYGKTSLVYKATTHLGRPVIAIDLQIVTSTNDLASQLLKRIYKAYPAERIKQYIKNFRIIPTITVNPVNNSIEVAFQTTEPSLPLLEDVLNLIDKLGHKSKRPVVIFDEFQEARQIGSQLLPQMRSIMQHHENVNYIFLGSQESAIKNIFKNKKSPFYHFGMVQVLEKIPEDDFMAYLSEGFRTISTRTDEPETLSARILEITKCHPYHTQKIAYMTWEASRRGHHSGPPEQQAIGELLSIQDADYERWWNSLNKTDQKVLLGLCMSPQPPLSGSFIRQFDLGTTSTVFSSLKRLSNQGIVIRNKKGYELDDPIFVIWLRKRREL